MNPRAEIEFDGWTLDTVEGSLSPAQGLPKVREAAERALALDPGLAEAHLRFLSYWSRSGDLRTARKRLAAAIALDPRWTFRGRPA